MKKIIAICLTALMLLSATVCLMPLTQALNTEDFNTSMPTFIYDFSESVYVHVQSNNNFTMNDSQGFLRLTALGDDPSLQMVTPQAPLEQLLWASVGYRAKTKEPNRYAEIYYSADNGEEMAEQTKMKWTWENQNDEWAVQVVHLTSFEDKPGVYLSHFRFDALAADWAVKVAEGDRIDLQYFAFFATEEDAAAFDYAEYVRYLKAQHSEEFDTKPAEEETHVILPGDWQIPTAEGVHYTPADVNEGSLTYTHNEDGTLTISYLLNGEQVSYKVPDTLQNAAGPLVGEDDLGRVLWDQYTVVDPDYTILMGTGDNVKTKTMDADEFTVGTQQDRLAREIGLFYFLWLGEHGDTGVHDISKILEEYGEGAASASCPAWAPVNGIHHFAEPLYGYYYSTDTWVMRKHVELLTNAGVDFLYFDTTNNYAYTDNAIRLMKILHEFNERGYQAPKVCFYTHTDAAERVKTIYNIIYKKNVYPDTWYCFEGKPLIVAPKETNIDNFFTMREPQWPNEAEKSNGWPWIDWNWPQHVYRNSKSRPESVNVSVAQHAGNSIFSSSALYGYVGNWGRSFNGTYDLLTDDSYKLGLNLQNEFNYAMTLKTPVVLVTGWNEWIAGRQDPRPGQPIVFIDTFNYEYSRDMEMSRGGYFDNYYMQLISNIRGIKGSAPTIVQDARNPINVTGSFDQWDKVIVSYPDPAGDTVERNGNAFGHTKLTDDSGRNDIVEVKVTNDTTYLYFYVRTADTILRPEAGKKSSWMQIFLNVDGKSTGWYGYDFILNNAPKSDLVTTLAKYSATEGYGFTDAYDVSYRVLGNEMMIAVPMEYLGVTEYDRVNLQFKVADSDTLIDEMEDFYIEGDAAPLGRPNFVYQTFIPGVTQGEGNAVIRLSDKLAMPVVDDPYNVETLPETEPITDAPATQGEGTEPSSSESETQASAGGCKSILAAGSLLLLLIPAALLVRRRKDEQ